VGVLVLTLVCAVYPAFVYSVDENGNNSLKDKRKEDKWVDGWKNES